MDSNDFKPWLEKASVQPSVLACAVKTDQSTEIVTGDPSFPDKRIKDLIQTLAEVGLTLRQDHITGGRLRWVFENAQIHSVRHADGAVALLILANDSNAAPVADHALREFVSVAPPEEPPLEIIVADGDLAGTVLDVGPVEGEPAEQTPSEGAIMEELPLEPAPAEDAPLESTAQIAEEGAIVNGVVSRDFHHN
jgi:hypothetical protein